MNKCPTCRNNLRFWQIKCPVCRSYVWKLPQILFLSTAIIGLILITIGAIIFSTPGNPQGTISGPGPESTTDLPAPGIKQKEVQNVPARKQRVEKNNGLTREQRKQRRMERRKLKNQ
jgi:hypothetical protein